MVLRPGNEGDRVTPARVLGMIHLSLERGDRKLNVSLSAPQKVQPETVVKVRVKAAEAKGQKAFVTLSAVDAGILNITRYASPDPHVFFFGKLRYGADQQDIYGRLIEKMQGQKGKLKFGGDNTPKPTRSLPKKVKLVDLFSGPVMLNEQGEAEIPLSLPDFNGTLRLMAVVATPDRFGSKDAEMTVAAPLVAELATPRFLSFGDRAVVALDLHNMSGAAQQLKVALAGGEGIALQDAREQGFGVPDAMYSKAMDFLLRGLQEGVSRLPANAPASARNFGMWQENRHRDNGRFGVLTYGAYVLAREKKAPLSTLRQLHELRSQAHSGLPLIHLGIALKLMVTRIRATPQSAKVCTRIATAAIGGGITAAPCATPHCLMRCSSVIRSLSKGGTTC